MGYFEFLAGRAEPDDANLFQFRNGKDIKYENDRNNETYNDEVEHESNVKMNSVNWKPDNTRFTGIDETAKGTAK